MPLTFSDADMRPATVQGPAPQVFTDEDLRGVVPQPTPSPGGLSALLPNSPLAQRFDQFINSPPVPLALANAGFKRGALDPWDEGAKMIVNALPESFVQKIHNLLPQSGPLAKLGFTAPTAAELNQTVANNQRDYEVTRANAGQTGTDYPRTLGFGVGSIPMMAATDFGAGPYAQSAISGGVAGALSLGDAQAPDYWSKKAIQTIVGGATGVAMRGASDVLGRIVNPRPQADVKLLLDQGVSPTIGQRLGPTASSIEDRLTSIPLVGDAIKYGRRGAIQDFNVGSYKQALEPIGETFAGEAGHAGVEEVGRKLGAAYDDVLPKVKFNADPEFFQDMTGIGQRVGMLTPDKRVQFQNIMKNEVIPRVKTGTMEGDTFKVMENELNGWIKKGSKSTSMDDQMLADRVGDVLGAFRENLQRVNPDYAERLQSINRGYAIYARIRDAAGRTGADHGVFTPAALAQASRAGDASAGKTATAWGNGLLQKYSEAGKSILGSYPDSGSIGRALATAGGMAVAAGKFPELELPALIAGGTAVAPYLPGARQGINWLMSSRPSYAPQFAAALSKATVPAQTLVINRLLSQQP